jgi:hypothetical protein
VETIESPENLRKRKKAPSRKKSITEKGVKILKRNKMGGSFAMFVIVDMLSRQN